MRRLFFVPIACLLLASACSTPQKTIYFSENTPLNPAVDVEPIDKRKEIVVLPEDILAIQVSTISSLTEKSPTSIFNSGGTGYNITATLGGAAGGTGQNNGYLVDPEGYIDYPVLGKVKVSGLTLRQVKELLADKLRNYVKDPVVEARIINYKITILGEVSQPGTIVAPNQKISVIDALAAAGDIPVTGRKDNILIIRETEGRREFARLNLNSKNAFDSPYFYLKQNDIVYVEPGRITRQQNNEFLQFYLPTILTLMSTALTVYGIIAISKQ